jgi:hypothetical protein
MYQLFFALWMITGLPQESTETSMVTGKMYFSNTPFGQTNAGAKSSFASNEFIYGRLEVQGGTLKEVFRINETSKAEPYPYVLMEVSVYRNGEQMSSSRSNNYILLKQEDLSRSYVNFDVLPDPAKATTLFSLLEDFSAGLGFFPLYHMIDEEHFPEPGNYTIKVRFFNRSRNAWGKEEEMEKWPELTDEFSFNFRPADIAALKKNKEAATETARENAFRYEKLPGVFANPAKISDPKANNAKISAILKRDLPNRTILKFAVENSGGPLWHIAKDDFGLPKYRYFNRDVWVAYKMDGRCYIGTVTLRENYSGGGTYGPLEVGFTSASGVQDKGIDCAKIK